MKWYNQTSLKVYPFKGNKTANPCGLIAKFRFNDEFVKISNNKNNLINIDDSLISHEIDEKKFVLN